MQKTITLSAIAPMIALILTACGSKNEQSAAPAPAPGSRAAMIASKDATCRALIESYNPDSAKTEASAQTYEVERVFQRVIRKNCENQVTSDKIETVRSPHVQFRLPLPKAREFQSVFVFNETSCDHVLSAVDNKPKSWAQSLASALTSLPSPIESDGKSFVDVKGDIATGLLTFEVKPGPNLVFAEYHYDCMPKGIRANVRLIRGGKHEQRCDASVDKQIVMYPIVMNYKETTRPDVSVVEPTKETCVAEFEAAKQKAAAAGTK